MPDPNGDGHGTPTSNVAFGGAVSAAAVTSDSVQSHGAEAGIIIVGGNSASTDGGSFWDQAASHAGAEAAAGVSSAAGLIASASVHAAAIETSATSAFDFSSVIGSSLHTAVVDHAVAHSTFWVAHSDVASMAHHETPSLSVGDFATHWQI
jgi:hypothetical protein